jgi:cytochrome c oxidase subunit 2
MRREWVLVGLVWAGLTALLEFVTWNVTLLPHGYSGEAAVSDEAFRFLLRMGIPVFAAVVAVLDVAVGRFRVRGAPDGDGPPVRSHRRLVFGWLGVTTGLALLLVVYPGLVGLADIRGESRADRVVRVEGARWFWTVTYPDAGVTTTAELVVPVGRRIRFEVTSKDVIHSFWVPAFRLKIDAVPGRTTVVYATAERTGTFQRDPGLRLQCAEMCGLGHATMRIPVRVVSEAEFARWLASQRSAAGQAQPGQGQAAATGTAGQAAPPCTPGGEVVRVRADALAFDRHCLAVPAGRPFRIAFDNAEAVPHNVAIYRDESAKKVLFRGDIVTGPRSATYRVKALPAGTYFYRCDLHPVPAMSGTFVVAGGGGA